tara:strand:+ start:7007 stop:7312 length:306 start_codon:yes stop_codon:yes gene_type:complete
MSKRQYNYLIGIAIFIFFGYTLLCKKPLQEGIIFTPYDNKKLFTKPWSQFCISPPPSCNKNLPQRAGLLGNPAIGCNCKNFGDAGNLDPNCDGTNHLYFFN